MPSGRNASFAAVLFTALSAATIFSAAPLSALRRQALPTRLSAPGARKQLAAFPVAAIDPRITLKFRNQEELQSLLRHLYGPASSNYRYFSPA